MAPDKVKVTRKINRNRFALFLARLLFGKDVPSYYHKTMVIKRRNVKPDDIIRS